MTVLVNVNDENDKKSGNLVNTTFTLDDNTSFEVELLDNGNYNAEGAEWKVESTGGKKRRSSKKSKKSKKSSKKSKKGGKKSRKTRKH